ncbi:MAG TPA: alpha/beta fold hydrolase [Steroidobacteraceae bacterium]|nr:alpha/beta fold hydrolase [Steroidobacteraceae bacterium]
MLGIDRFITDDGQDTMLISDYSSGVVRRLFPAPDDAFVMGPGFASASPVELTVRFVTDDRGTIKGISLRRADGTQAFAERVPLNQEEVSFEQADAKLAGTLFMPANEGPHPAIILLHGSGPLTRYKFGPYPHFFTSLGFAVLIYDKRGTGSSTGLRMDASTGTVMKASYYPDDLANDALAALSFLRRHEGIDSDRIGFWGSSEGGMLATFVASRSKDVAFAINSSGFMEPLWQTLHWQVGAILRAAGAPAADIDRQQAFVDLWMRVARTGKGWEEFKKREQHLVESNGSWIFQSRGPFTSVEQLRWDWDHVLTFDPLPALEKVTCPVLGVFGELDTATPAARTAENMRRVLTRAGHQDFMIRIFPNAGHSLSELPAKSRMAPGVFETLRSWLLTHVRPEAAG